MKILSRFWSYLAPLLTAIGMLAVAPAANGQSNLVLFVSAPGDYIGQGQTYSTTTDFSISGGGGNANVSAFGYNFNIAAPAGQDFVVGTYYNTTRTPFAGAGPGIDIEGNGRGCNQDCGSFQVLEVGTDANGNINRLWLKFTNLCECFMAPETGEIRYNSQLATANIPPIITSQPPNQSVLAGNTATFSAGLGGPGPFTCQWKFNGANLPGQTASTLVLPDVQPDNDGLYSVTISDGAGSTNSVAASLDVLSSAACVTPPSGIVSWWRAEGGALDSVGGNNGTLAGDAGFAPGKVGLAFSLTNTGAFISVPDSPALNFGSGDFTIELWVQFISTGGTQAFMAKDEGPGNTSKWIFWLNQGKLQFQASAGLTIGGGTFNPILNHWHHVAVTRSGPTFSFYVDGALNSTGASTAPIPQADAPLTLGQAENTFFLDGLEDEVTIYSRALSATEIQAIYNADSAGKCVPPSPPVVVTPPEAETVFAGNDVSFNVLAAGGPTLSYQWEFDGTNIADATNYSITLDNVQLNQSGNYSVTVATSSGTTNSANALLTVLTPGSCLPPPAGLVSWWTADGTVTDSAGTNEGTMEGGAGFAAGEVGLAFDFQNGSGYVQVPDSPSLNFGGNDFSIELCANFTSLTGSRALIAKDNGPGANNKWIFWLNGGQLQFLVQTGQSGFNVGSAAFSPALNTWHHLALTRSGSFFSFYVDGALVSTGSSGTPIPTIAAPLTIGQAEGGNFIGGLEDEVSIYGRALSASEVQSIYEAGTAGKCAPPRVPVLVTQPQAQTVFAGTTASFNVLAGGSQPLTYQWKMNGTNVPAAVNPTAASATLILTNTQLSESGNYSVTVSNLAGFTNSTSAQLDVRLPASCSVPAGIVSWWTAEGNATDSAGTNEGTMEGGAGFAAGEVGQAFDFRNGSGYVQVPDSPSLDFGGNDFSIELWANFTSLTGSGALIAKDNGPGANNKWIFWLNGGQLQFLVQTGQSGFNVGSAAFSPALNTWHHLALTRSGSFFSFYVDGVLVSTDSSGAPIPAITAPLTIGEAENTAFMGGLEDEVTIYSRALSAPEIETIYLEGSAGKCGTPLAPFIVSQSQSQAVFLGSTANFSVVAGGSPPLGYQWLYNGTNIPVATNASLALTNVQPAQSGSYSVTVNNSAGFTNSSSELLTVVTPGSCLPPPAGLVSWWTADGTVTDSAGTNEGTMEGGAGFAAGEVGLAFDFQNGSGYVQVPDSPSLNFGGNDFSIELWANFTSLTGNRALIAKDNGPGADNKWIFWLNGSQLQFLVGAGTSQTTVGTAAFTPALNTWHHLAVTRNGLLFSFYVDGALVSTGSSGTPIPTITAPLTIGQAEGGNFMGGLEDEVSIYGRALSASEVQSIYEAGTAGKCAPLMAPTLVTQPQAESIFAGTTASFNVLAGGSPPLGYQWLYNGTDIPAATNAVLVLTNAQPGESGNYSVTVSNLAGSTNSVTAMLTVNVPACVTAPAGIVGWWAGEGNALDSAGTNHGTSVNGVGFTNGLVGEAFRLNGINQYVDVPNYASLNPTNAVTLEAWINPAEFPPSAPIIKKAGQGPGGPDGYTLELGGSSGVLFGAYINGGWVTTAPAPVSLNQWTHVAGVYDGTNLYTYVNGALAAGPVHVPGTIGSSGNDLNIGHDASNPSRYFNGLIDEASVYSNALSAAQILSIYNAYSAGKCPIPLPPSIALQPQSQSVLQGSNATFTVFAGGTSPFGYQWQFDQQNISGANSATLTIANVQASSAGAYSVIITNTLGSTNSANANLSVLLPPEITFSPFSQLVRPGCTVTFNSSANGTAILTYQWQFNGTNLPSQTNTSLTIVGVQTNNFGHYTMIAQNAYGRATSAVAVLALDHPPVPGNVVVQRFPGAGVRMGINDLLAGATDADGDPLSIIAVAASSIEGGAVSLVGTSVYYLPPAGLAGADAFTYTISDGHCEGTAVGAVLVSVRTDTNTASRAAIYQMPDGSVQVIFDGMPGVDYRIQSADTLTPPDWQDVTNLTADQYGAYTYTDWPSTNGPVRFFRSVTP